MLRMTPRRFAELVDDALDSIPAELMRLLDNVIVRIAERDDEDPDLLGLYDGVALTERTHDYTFAAPDTITVFREPILAMCADEDEVSREVAITVVHELGHHFGIDDDRLDELGWG